MGASLTTQRRVEDEDFRVVIPHSEAGHPRVTHPFATLLTPCGAFAFDLHVLGTPPALILSQDQTLVRICLWNIISYWLFVQYPIMTLLQSFVRELYRSSS